MLSALHRVHGPEASVHRSVESALRAAGILIATLLAVVILFLGVFVTRAV